MIIKTFIFTFDREDMLNEQVKHLNEYGISPIILDDGSTYETNLPRYKRHEHRGIDGFWKTWNEALSMCKNSEAELFLFMPDDFEGLNVKRMFDFHDKFKHTPYAFNIINDGRDNVMGTGVMEVEYEDYTMCGWVDCGFFCNKLALDRIGYEMKQPFKPPTSSGVGRELSFRFLLNKVVMYRPTKSLAYHGEHESKMHPQERIINPLISK